MLQHRGLNCWVEQLDREKIKKLLRLQEQEKLNRETIIKDYLILDEINEKDNRLNDVLNRIGGANYTVCPECHVDDFVHVEGCSILEEIKKKDA